MKALRATDFKEVPWRNGGGTTTEMYVEPHPKDEARFAFRVSMARVASDGPFSNFAGYERLLMLTDGEGFTLTLNGLPVKLDEPLKPVRFDGGTLVTCTLVNGPCTDFNLMVARDFGRGDLRVKTLTQGETDTLSGYGLVYVHAGGVSVENEKFTAGEAFFADTDVMLEANIASTLIMAHVFAENM
jgi:uncharacterized protein